jgi:predicted secreted protein
MLSILYNMSADAYAKLVAHNNTIVQQFKTYKESQERALAEAYGRLAALKEFCAKEREEMREAFEKEKQALALEKQEMREVFEQEKQAMRDEFEREKHSALALEKQAGGEVDTNQILNKALSGFFRNV